MLELKPEITYGDLTAAGIGVAVVLLLGMLSFIYTQILQSVDDRTDLIAALRNGKVRRLYQGGVNWLLRGLQKLYGNKDSLQAFGVSYLLSFIYPFLFFILTYSYFDGTHLFSGSPLLFADLPYRTYFFPIFLLVLMVTGIVFKFLMRRRGNDDVDNQGKTQLQRLGLPHNVANQVWRIAMGLLASAVSWFFLNNSSFSLMFFVFGYSVLLFLLGYSFGALAVALIFAIAGIFVVAGIIGDSFAVDADGFVFVGILGGAVAVVYPFVSSAAVAILAIVIFAVATLALNGVVSGAGWEVSRGNYYLSLMFAFFYLALPLVNALLDWLSWWVSRFFLERTAQESRVRVIVLDVLLDFGVAVLFMLALCLLLPAGAMVLDSLYAGWVDVKSGVPAQTGWQEYAVWARDDPWGRGIMVTLMLVTTLIPTLLHILMGLMAFFIHGFKGAALADFLEQPRRNLRDGIASLWMFGYVVLAGAALWAMYQVFQYFAQWPIAQWLYDFTGYFYDLP